MFFPKNANSGKIIQQCRKIMIFRGNQTISEIFRLVLFWQTLELLIVICFTYDTFGMLTSCKYIFELALPRHKNYLVTLTTCDILKMFACKSQIDLSNDR